MNGPNYDISSYYLNQFGLAGGQLPVESCLIDGQSRFSFIGFNPVACLVFSFTCIAKYLISYKFRVMTLSANISTFDFCRSPSSEARKVLCSLSTLPAMISHSFSNLRHSSSYWIPHYLRPSSTSSFVGSGTEAASSFFGASGSVENYLACQRFLFY